MPVRRMGGSPFVTDFGTLKQKSRTGKEIAGVKREIKKISTVSEEQRDGLKGPERIQG